MANKHGNSDNSVRKNLWNGGSINVCVEPASKVEMKDNKILNDENSLSNETPQNPFIF